MADKPVSYEGTQEEWDQVMDHLGKMSRSLLNNLFDGEETLKTEAFWRILSGQSPLTVEEIEARVKKWAEKEEEIWRG